MTERSDVVIQQKILDLLMRDTRRESYSDLDQLLSCLKVGTVGGTPFRVFVSEYTGNERPSKYMLGAVRVMVDVNNLSYEDSTVREDTYTPTKFEITPEVWAIIQAKNEQTLNEYNQLKQELKSK